MKSKIKYRVTAFIIFITLAYSTTTFAQEDKISPRINISFQRSDQNPAQILLNVRKRIEGRFLPMQGIAVNVSMVTEFDDLDLGTTNTDSNGLAQIEFTNNIMAQWDTLSEVEFIATIAESDSTTESEESLLISHARIRISAEDDHLFSAVVEKRISQGEWEPVADVELKFFIKRYFGLLPVGDEFYTTDENGEIEMEFDSVIPGDAEGNILLGCLIDDNEEFGTISATISKKWGTAFFDDNAEFNRRTLWSTRDKTPYWLLIFPNLIILGVWGLIVYLVFQIIKIKKLQNQS